MQDILDAFERLAERVATAPRSRMDPFVSASIRRACEELRRFIPGLEVPPDAEAARFLARAAYAAMEDNDAREALARSLRGLSFAPHHPGLHYVAATACFEFGAVEDAIRLLRHTLWIHPGHEAARRDLASLSAYLEERWNSAGAFSAEEASAFEPAGESGPDLAFEYQEEAGEAYPEPGEEDLEPWDEPDDEERAA